MELWDSTWNRANYLFTYVGEIGCGAYGDVIILPKNIEIIKYSHKTMIKENPRISNISFCKQICFTYFDSVYFSIQFHYYCIFYYFIIVWFAIVCSCSHVQIYSPWIRHCLAISHNTSTCTYTIHFIILYSTIIFLIYFFFIIFHYNLFSIAINLISLNGFVQHYNNGIHVNFNLN